jgi:hypothetical protein
MLAQYGENCNTERKMYQWVEMFWSGWTNVIDEDHWGHLTTLQTADSIERVNTLVYEDTHITVTDIADKLDICWGPTYSIIDRDLGYHKIYARWVPEQLQRSIN